MSQYELTREQNIERNRALLEALGLDKPFFEPAEKPRVVKQAKQLKKRKATADESETTETVSKVSRSMSNDVVQSGARRSQRNVNKTINYAAEQIRGSPVPISVKSGVRALNDSGSLGREDGTRLHDPKTFGSIPGIAVGTWWEGRKGCSVDAIHAPLVAGISGGKEGAYSVALSGGYDDDVDLGYAFTYTGSGGRDLKGTKNAPKNLRTAPQSSDQTFENGFNKALQVSSETKKPVRVIRGYKLKSPYAPSEGYRYDGLYRVEQAWIEKGLNPKGYLVCKFAFKRLDGQPPLPVRSDVHDDATDEEPQGSERP